MSNATTRSCGLTADHFRDLFARFSNLDLLCLIEDLRLGKVVSGKWLDQWTGYACPMGHAAFPRRWGADCSMSAAKYLCVHADQVILFVHWWDRNPDPRNLLPLLENIFRERQEDADAAQAVMEQPKEVLT